MTGRRNRQSQRGAALLIFMIIMVTAMLTYVVTQLTPEMIEARRAQKTQEALAQAKDALIGYALTHRERKFAQDPPVPDAVYGYLPMPDLGETINLNAGFHPCETEGCSKFNNSGVTAGTTYVGHFPWLTLGTGPVRDGYASCLWYAVSGTHQALENSTTMNWDTLGQIDPAAANYSAASGNRTGHDAPIAVIFAPGPASATARPTVPGTQCGGDYTVSRYLDESNPRGIAITGDDLFGAIRKNRLFRSDLKEMLQRMAKCWSRNLAALAPVAIDGYSPPPDKIAGRIPAAPASCDDAPDTAYGDDRDPRGYFKHYGEMIFIARPEPAGGHFTVNGDTACKGVLLFSGPRTGGQRRVSAADKNDLSNYLEGDNHRSLSNPDIVFSGDPVDADAPPQANGTDIAICIPDPSVYDPRLVSPAVLGENRLVAYDTASGTLTLGKAGVSSEGAEGYPAAALFGCAWFPEKQAGGLRAYFSFRIGNSGEGFAFAAVDARRNTAAACGGAAAHLGYSGDNTYTPAIVHPKIGVEIDTSKQASAYPAGRADPDYKGGHLAIVYWGGETTADDDNVHGLPPATDPPPVAASRPPPGNPPVPAVVTQNGAGVARLDSGSVSNLVGQNIHVRVEITPVAVDAASRSKTYLVDTWLEKGDSDTNVIAAMKNTTRPLASLYPGIDTAAFIHLRDRPVIYGIAGPGCANAACPAGYDCAADNICYMEAFKSIRPGFTVSQGTLAKDQIIRIEDLVLTWLP